jgi:hypothetical protein
VAVAALMPTLVSRSACPTLPGLSCFVVSPTGALVGNVAASPVLLCVSAVQRDLAARLDFSLACCELAGTGAGESSSLQKLAISYPAFTLGARYLWLKESRWVCFVLCVVLSKHYGVWILFKAPVSNLLLRVHREP